jgi:hypothetical protein
MQLKHNETIHTYFHIFVKFLFFEANRLLTTSKMQPAAHSWYYAITFMPADFWSIIVYDEL